MNDAMKVFNALISQCKTSMGLYEYIVSNSIPVDASDLLRWQYVSAVSALDKYIHDIVSFYMIKEFRGERVKTPKYFTLKFDLSTVELINESATPELVFSDAITRQLSYLTYQDPDKISDGLSLIWNENDKWEVISSNMPYSISKNDLRIKLKNIVIRRNQIAHQGDCLSMQFPLTQQTLIKEDVENVIDFLIGVVYAIDRSIA